jgi:glutamate-1-semialdehyde 2,1-aminomutase
MTLNLSKSQQLQQRAERVIPGGVDSPVRAFRSVGGAPPFLVRGEGSCVWDADGNTYIDYVGQWGPAILGHAHPNIVEAIQRVAKDGCGFGASHPYEAQLAELINAALPGMEKVRFVNSGTEATMSAIRLARAAASHFTGQQRDIIIKFEGCYHGHVDALLVKAGSGVATLGIPGSAGVPEAFASFTLALPYNDLDAVREAFTRHKNKIAAVIVEPVVGNMGCVIPRAGYLEGLRVITSENGALLIYDEVMTGFRLAWGGAQCGVKDSSGEQLIAAVQPDITTLGKVIGGGMPVGAYAGSARIMDMVAPLGPVYQAGTLSGNPIAMAAGIASLTYLRDHKEIYIQLDSRADQLCKGVMAAAQNAVVKLACNRVGSMFTFFFGPVTPEYDSDADSGSASGNVSSFVTHEIIDWDTAAKSDTAAFARFHRAMLENGIYLPPSQFEAMFLGAAHTEQDIETTITAAAKSLA